MRRGRESLLVGPGWGPSRALGVSIVGGAGCHAGDGRQTGMEGLVGPVLRQTGGCVGKESGQGLVGPPWSS